MHCNLLQEKSREVRITDAEGTTTVDAGTAMTVDRQADILNGILRGEISGHPGVPTIEEGLQAVLVVDAARESIDSGRIVPVELFSRS